MSTACVPAVAIAGGLGVSRCFTTRGATAGTTRILRGILLKCHRHDRVSSGGARRTRRARGSRCSGWIRAATKETFSSFDDLIAGSSVPVLVDFYAQWCGPCQLLSTQVLPQLAANVGPDRVKLVKINTEKYPNIASKFKVEALPTIMLFKNGKVVDRIEGLPETNQLIQRLQYFLAT